MKDKLFKTIYTIYYYYNYYLNIGSSYMNKYLLSPIKNIDVLTSNKYIYNLSFIWINFYYFLYKINLLRIYLNIVKFPINNKYLVKSLINGSDRYKIFGINLPNMFHYYDTLQPGAELYIVRKPIINLKIQNKDENEDINQVKNVLNKHDTNDLFGDILLFNKIDIDGITKIKVKFINKETEICVDNGLFDTLTVNDIYK